MVIPSSAISELDAMSSAFPANGTVNSTFPNGIPRPTSETAPALTFMLIGMAMCSTMVMMLLALVFFSTPQLRRKPIFWLNVIAVVLGAASGATNVTEEVR